MKRSSLRSLFDAVLHGKFDFEDFLHGRIRDNYDVLLTGPANHRREIFRPNKKLKIYQTFIKDFLIEYLPINGNVVFSYRRGFSVFDAVKTHASSRYFFQTDISSFFSNISCADVRSLILKYSDSSPIVDIPESIDRIIDLVCVNGTLPIGFPTSAPLSNSVLLDFDNALEAHCSAAGLKYSRFSDDIIISGNEKASLTEINNIVQDLLIRFASPRLTLNTSKSRHFQVGGKVKILGLMILPNGRITIDSKVKREIELLLHFWLTDKVKFIEATSDDEVIGLNKLAGLLNYAKSIDTEYIEKLRKKFGVTTVDSILHRDLMKQ